MAQQPKLRDGYRAIQPDKVPRRTLSLGETALLGGAAAALVVGIGSQAPVVGEPIRNTVGGVVGKVWESTLGAPTHEEQLKKEFEEAKAHPEDVKPGKYVTYMVDGDTNPGQIAQDLAKDEQYAEVKAEVEAQEVRVKSDKLGIMVDAVPQGPILLETQAVDMANHTIAAQVTPFPAPEQ